MGENQYFFVSDAFGKEADWSVVGTGKVSEGRIDIPAEARMVRIGSGYVSIWVSDFSPSQNISFGLFSSQHFTREPLFFQATEEKVDLALRQLALNGDYTERELKSMRNTIFARYGYVFKNPGLKTYFSKRGWYMPDPNLKMKDIELTVQEKPFVDAIIKREKK